MSYSPGSKEDFLEKMRERTRRAQDGATGQREAKRTTERKLVVSLFTHIADNAPKICETTWSEVLGELHSPKVVELAGPATPEARKRAKSALSAWSFAKFRGKRSSRNVQEVSLLVFDVDNTGASGNPLSAELRKNPEQAATVLKRYAGAVATSFSHSVDHPKFRVLLQLSRQSHQAAQAPVAVAERAGRGAGLAF